MTRSSSDGNTWCPSICGARRGLQILEIVGDCTHNTDTNSQTGAREVTLVPLAVLQCRHSFANHCNRRKHLRSMFSSLPALVICLLCSCVERSWDCAIEHKLKSKGKRSAVVSMIWVNRSYLCIDVVVVRKISSFSRQYMHMDLPQPRRKVSVKV